MSLLRNSLHYMGLAAFLAIAACSPATEEPAESGASHGDESAAAPAEHADAPAHDHADHEATEATPASDDDGIDRSITDSAPYGDDAMLEGLVPSGWKQAGPIEHYNVATLYNKINGRSELYMAYDVLGLSWVSFVKEDSPDDFLDLFVYDLRTPANAFGIFSVEREPGQESADLGRLSYRTGSNYYFWKGKYYGYMNASRENVTNTTTGVVVLSNLMPRLEDNGDPVAGMNLLPEDGLIQDTVQYFKVDAMSLDFLTDTWAGQYNVGDAKVRAFVSKRASAEEAGQILEAFRGYGDSYAESTSDAKIEGVDVVVSDWGGGFFDAAFHIGDTFAGASNVEGRETLDAATASLIKQLKKR